LKISKMVLIPISLLILMALLIVGCSTKTSTTTTTTAATSTTTTTAATTTKTTTTAPTTAAPVTGGNLRIVAPSFASDLGYPPAMAPADSIQMQPILERLCYWLPDGSQTGLLAASWDITPTSLTWHLRQGVKFTDGTDFNAESLKWNYQLAIDTKRMTDVASLKSMEVLDTYTLRLNVTQYNQMMLTNYGWGQQISPTAYLTAGGTIPSGSDNQKSIDWARLNPVGTGPFMLGGYTRDTVIKYVKNPNYWQKGYPYLDSMELRLIPDVMTAAATMEAGQADMWIDAANVTSILGLESKGIVSNWGPGMFNLILYNSTSADSPTSKIGVRQAIETAINRPALADMLGSGKYEALTQMAPQKMPGYVAGFNPYPYDPAKAKQLLADAGYPNGFKTKMMITSGGTDAAAGIKAYLAAVGIDVTIDIADLGRYFGEVFGTGYTDDMVLSASGINPDGTDLFVHFARNPMTFRTANIYKSPAYLDLCDKALYATDTATSIGFIKQAVKQAGVDALFTPLYRSVDNAELQKYVHSDYFMIHGATWTPWDDWMDKH
jgi:peptide/nickel transport system substrate-binding protein